MASLRVKNVSAMDPEQIRLKKTDVATTLARLW